MRLILLTISLLLTQFYAFSQAAIDTSFKSVGGFDNTVSSLALQQDGKLIAVGSFSHYGLTQCDNIARLNPDGTLDKSFKLKSRIHHDINKVLIQNDQKIIIVGYFTMVEGKNILRIARFNTDGSLDLTFETGSGANGIIYDAVIDANGKIIIAGDFTSFNSQLANRIVRLNTDGTIDDTFTSGTGANDVIKSIIIDSQERIVIAGNFTQYNNVSKSKIARLESDGALDNTFTTPTFSNGIAKLAELPDERIFITGTFNSPVNKLAILSPSGSIDNSFVTGSGTNDFITACHVNQDKIYLAGNFTQYNGINAYRIVALNFDGSIASEFQPNWGPNKETYSIISNGSGKLLLSGAFDTYDLETYNGVVKINTDGTADPSFTSGYGATSSNTCFIELDDETIIVGGQFKKYNHSNYNYLVKVTRNGEVDHLFNSDNSGPNAAVTVIEKQPDGKILLAGYFTEYNNVSRNGIARIHADGSLDESFNPATGTNFIRKIKYTENKILVCGDLFNLNGVTTKNIIRLNDDGSLDNSFTSGGDPNYLVYTFDLQSTGKIVISEANTYMNPMFKLRRLNSDGTEDNTFYALPGGTGANNRINCVKVLKNDKIAIGGYFSNYQVEGKTAIAILDKEGEIDSTFKASKFSPNGSFAYVNDIEEQANGKLVIGGNFIYGNLPNKINYFTRLTTSYSLDPSFRIDGNILPTIESVLLLKNGDLLVASYGNYYADVVTSPARITGDPTNVNTFRGKIYVDENSNCIYDAGEKTIPDVLVTATPGPWYGFSDENGDYIIEAGSSITNITIKQTLNPTLEIYTSPSCPVNGHTFNFTGQSKDTCCINFANEVSDCHQLGISVESNRRRRCFRNQTYVRYWNKGYTNAADVQVKVILPEYLIPISSTPAWTTKIGSMLIYDIASVNAGDYKIISIIDSVQCGDESILGITQCTKATISPYSNCINPDPLYSGSMVEVNGICKDSKALFTIKNTGAGDMEEEAHYRIYLNDTIINFNTYLLESGDSLRLSVIANGKTVRLEADQSPGYPYNSHPMSIVEGCIDNTTTPSGFVNTTPQDNNYEEQDIHCMVIQGSYDPNDKQAMPSGYTDNNYLSKSTTINYSIRFENTGSDTAFNVVVVDTLNENLDIAAFARNNSSHLYNLKVKGEGRPVLVFTFENINLPPKSTDSIKSQGFVSFVIRPLASVSENTIIENNASIYFDYNSPIVTNTVSHTIKEFQPDDFTKSNLVTDVTSIITGKWTDPMSIYPNPCSHEITIDMKEGVKNTFKLYTSSGQKVIETSVQFNSRVNLETLDNGLYFYQISDDNGNQSTGKLLKTGN